MQRNEATDFTLLHPHLAHKSTTHPRSQFGKSIRLFGKFLPALSPHRVSKLQTRRTFFQYAYHRLPASPVIYQIKRIRSLHAVVTCSGRFEFPVL